MPDRPFESMTPTPSGLPRSLRETPTLINALGFVEFDSWTRCEKCKGRIMLGDWPWCSGNPADHDR